MPKNIRDILATYLKKIGIEEGKVAALFNAEGTEVIDSFESELTQYDAARIIKIKSESKTEGFKEGNDKGFRDGAIKWEDEAKKKFEITSDKKGIDLVDEIVALKSNIKPELEEDKVKLHPLYLKMQKDLTDKVKQVETDFTKKYDDREKQITKNKILNEVYSKASKIVTDTKYVLPSDEKRKLNQLNSLNTQLSGFDFNVDPNDDNDYIITKDGKAFEDNHGVIIKFTDLVSSLADNLWDKENGLPRSTPGNNNGAPIGQGKKVVAPKDEQDFINQMKAAKTPEDRIAIDDAWTASQVVTN